MKTETTKELTKKQATLPSVFAVDKAEVQEFDPSDILIPKLLLMQGTSQLVAEGKASQGDMLNSVTGETLGDKTKGITFIPLTHYKTMTVMRNKDGVYVFDHTEPWTSSHALKQWEENINGVTYRNYPTLNFYVMTEQDLKKEGNAMPLLLSFKSTSIKAGKKLVNHFAMAADIGRAACSGMLTLSCSFQKGEKGPYHAFDVKFEKDTPAEYAPKIERWLRILKQNKVKVDATDETPVEDTSTGIEAQF